MASGRRAAHWLKAFKQPDHGLEPVRQVSILVVEFGATEGEV